MTLIPVSTRGCQRHHPARTPQWAVPDATPSVRPGPASGHGHRGLTGGGAEVARLDDRPVLAQHEHDPWRPHSPGTGRHVRLRHADSRSAMTWRSGSGPALRCCRLMNSSPSPPRLTCPRSALVHGGASPRTRGRVEVRARYRCSCGSGRSATTTAETTATMMRWPTLAQWPRASLSTTSATAATAIPPMTPTTTLAVHLDRFTPPSSQMPDGGGADGASRRPALVRLGLRSWL
jgi:hypothetical protein